MTKHLSAQEGQNKDHRSSFQSLFILSKEEPQARLHELTLDQLPAGEVLVRIAFSTLNYKDALAVSGQGQIVRSFPMAPGIDFSGVVEASDSDLFKQGDQVLLTGWGVGERYYGGLSEYVRVPAKWLLPLPIGMSLRQSMILGTAGLTAAMCLAALERSGVTPQAGELLVTGATGGVGSVAVALAAQKGFQVTAVTGKSSAESYLRELGATNVLDRQELLASGKRPLVSERWAGVIDTAGGEVLAAALAGVRYGGSVAACGLAADHRLATTVFPFILRGVSLLGVDSVMAPLTVRIEAWKALAQLPQDLLTAMVQPITLREVPEAAERLLAGKVTGRFLVEVNNMI